MRIGPCALALLVGAFDAGTASPQLPATTARAGDVMGKAERRTATAPETWGLLRTGDTVPGDSAVRTGPGSAVLLALPDQHVMRIGENTTLEIKALGQNHAFSFALLKGRIWSFVDKAIRPARYEIETGSVILGVSGTLFSVARDDSSDEADASVEDGEVRLRRGRMQKTLTPGLQIRVMKGRLGMAVPRKQSRATLAMWKAIGTQESWAKPHGALRLNKQVEERARGVQQERQAEKTRASRPGRARRR